ncbi:uncharacterized protein BT62DRAFT_935061 [Guyanagaster necrorhizus]|uniref:Uncharacterized protein n=1 Tax=Guyanagaster necrorhizus TaxID=856835 RepID=A0A9P7VMU8_9AGAR|nr:uncharacterized protein BT62DRAFT_935061 [Guyanagaster necrorhizus MCA 3950]KAG7443438.1 hypothetical protein BT62DRAFT_935061 [Guyanagaster necrorhizus MCA 3950]
MTRARGDPGECDGCADKFRGSYDDSGGIGCARSDRVGISVYGWMWYSGVGLYSKE